MHAVKRSQCLRSLAATARDIVSVSVTFCIEEYTPVFLYILAAPGQVQFQLRVSKEIPDEPVATILEYVARKMGREGYLPILDTSHVVPTCFRVDDGIYPA